MTTHSDTHPPQPTPEKISGPGDLIAAIPALLGFVPHRSLLLMCIDEQELGRQTLGTVMRHDLILAEREGDAGWRGGIVTPEMIEVIDRYCEVCERNDVHTAVAVIVDDRAAIQDNRNTDDPRFENLATTLIDRLSGRGTRLSQVFLTADLVAGSPWSSLTGTPAHGRVSDPTLSPIALANLVEGRRVHSSRSALEDVLAPVDSALSVEVAECIEAARESDNGTDKQRLSRIVAQISAWAATSSDRPAVVELPPTKVAEFGVALTHLMVRDGLLAMALTASVDIAEQLWTFLMKLLPAPERACAATLLGFSAYSRGEGALAAVAIDIALDADPDYSLARLLDRSLLAGAKPDMIREVALSGYAVAELCGVRLPPPFD